MPIAAAAVFAVAVMCGVTWAVKKPPRHHIYYCLHDVVPVALPCMYRKNDPVDV